MKINHVEIDETYAEGFGMYASRLLITAETMELAKRSAIIATGYATSTIHCDAEAGIDHYVAADKTPDGRPGVAILICVQKKGTMDEVLLGRVGQCILTAPTTSCFDWFPKEAESEKTFEVKTGFKLKFFGDGFEEKQIINFNGNDITCWKVPVMDGYFVVQNSFKVSKIAGGGNFMVMGKDAMKTIEACDKAIEKMMEVDGVVLPFPGGYVRSPSKLGSKKYSKFLNASTNDPLSPVLRDKIDNSVVPEGVVSGYEFVINGLDKSRVEQAMKAGIMELCNHETIVKVTAGNYGGKLGKIFYNLKDILS